MQTNNGFRWFLGKQKKHLIFKVLLVPLFMGGVLVCVKAEMLDEFLNVLATKQLGVQIEGNAAFEKDVYVGEKVGIGTAEPGEALTVEGVVEAKEGVKFGDGSVMTGAVVVPELVSEEEATMGEDNEKYMSALRTKEMLAGAVGTTPVAGTDITAAEANAEKIRTSSTFGKMKEIRIAESGTYTISFDVKTRGGYPAYAQVRKNGVLVGEQQTVYGSTTSYVTKTQDLSFEKGDLCQLYLRYYLNSGSPDYMAALVKDFRVRYSLKKDSADATVLLD